MNGQIEGEHAPAFFAKLTQVMSSNQIMNLKQTMENKKGICIEKPAPYKIMDLYDSVYPQIRSESHGLSYEGSLRRSVDLIKNTVGTALKKQIRGKHTSKWLL